MADVARLDPGKGLDSATESYARSKVAREELRSG
jgi:hypothetical protein